MNERLRNFYLEAQINSASPGQALIMLYDALLEQAECVESELSLSTSSDQGVKAADAVSRCIKILTELSSTLNFGVNPELCGTLRNLYVFFTREIAEALEKRAPRKVHAILPLIRELRGAWAAVDRRPCELQFVAA